MNLNKLILTSLAAIITATGAYAAGENVVASKKYTDDTFQQKIEWDQSTLDPEITLLGPGYEPGALIQHAIGPDLYTPLTSTAQAAPGEYIDFGGNITSWNSSRDGDLSTSIPSIRMLGEVTSSKQPMIPALADAMEYTPGFVLLPSGGDDGQLGLRFIIPGLDEMPDLSASGQGYYDVRDWWLFGGEMNEDEVTAMLDDMSRQYTNEQWFNGEGVGMTLNDILYSPASLKLVSDVWNELKPRVVPSMPSGISSISGDAGTLVAGLDENGVVTQRLIIPGYKSASGNGEMGTAMYQQSNNGTEPWMINANDFAGMLDDIYRNFNDGNGMGYNPKYSVPSMELALNWVGDIWNSSQRTITGHAANAADSILTDSATNGVVNKRAIFDGSATYAAATHATHIPTMGAVMSAITNGTPKITWSATQTAAVNNYSTTFNGTANNWVATDSGKLVDGAVLANAVALKQNKIPANNATTYPNGSVVTYGATAGTPGQVAIASAEARDANNQLTNGSNIANVTLVATKQNKKVCAGWPDYVAVADRTDANCWLWTFPD